MTIEKPYYQAPQHETDPGYIDPKELQDIFKQLEVSEMVKLNPGAYEYMMSKYYNYLKRLEWLEHIHLLHCCLGQ